MTIVMSKAFTLIAFSLLGAQLASATTCNKPCVLGQCLKGTCVGGAGEILGGICECDMSMTGDPELEGLDGRHFFFDGEANATFNLISEEHHQVNAFFVEGPHKIAVLGSTVDAHNGTWVGSMGFKFNGQKVQVDTDDEGAMTVAVNGKEVVLNQENDFEEVQTFDKLNVTTRKYHKGVGESVRLESDLCNLLVYATPKAWDEATQQTNRGHLNMGMAVNTNTLFSRTIHGVLGQITPNTHPDVSALPEELREAFLGEGEQNDYKVSGLFADDFKFNLYGEPVPKKMAVYRRHLMEGAPSQEWITLGFMGS